MNVWNDFAKPVVVLGSICVLTGALLAVTHSVTQPLLTQTRLQRPMPHAQNFCPKRIPLRKILLSLWTA